MIRQSTPVLLILIGLLTGTIYGVSSCASTPEGRRVQLIALSRELELGAADLRDLSTILQEKRPEVAAQLLDLADILDQVKTGLDSRLAGEDTPSLAEIISIGLQTTEAMTEDPDVKAVAFVVRSVLRRVAQYTDSL